MKTQEQKIRRTEYCPHVATKEGRSGQVLYVENDVDLNMVALWHAEGHTVIKMSGEELTRADVDLLLKIRNLELPWAPKKKQKAIRVKVSEEAYA
jgi:hypothetical protein